MPGNKKDIVIINAMNPLMGDNERKATSLHEQYDDRHNDVSNLLFIKGCSNIGDAEKSAKSSIAMIKCFIDNNNPNEKQQQFMNSIMVNMMIHQIHYLLKHVPTFVMLRKRQN